MEKGIRRWICGLLLVSTCLMVGCTEPQTLKIGNVQGVSYSGDGQSLYFATDAGVLRYTNPTGWERPQRGTIEGYTATKSALYAGGKGLQKSTDGGKTFQTIALKGVHFDLVAAAYFANTIYVWVNEDSKPLQKGLNYTKDEGATWTHVAALGVNEKPLCLAVNPEDDRWVAIGTNTSLSLSGDRGETFNFSYPQLQNTRVTAVTFDTHTPEMLVLGTHYQGKSQVVIAPYSYKYFTTGLKVSPDFWQAPFQTRLLLEHDDEVTHLTNNPANERYVATTRKGKVYRFNSSIYAKPETLLDGVVQFNSGQTGR